MGLVLTELGGGGTGGGLVSHACRLIPRNKKYLRGTRTSALKLRGSRQIWALGFAEFWSAKSTLDFRRFRVYARVVSSALCVVGICLVNISGIFHEYIWFTAEPRHRFLSRPYSLVQTIF